MNVVFDVLGDRYPLHESVATVLAEDLHQAGSRQPGAPAARRAAEVADEIDAILGGRRSEPVALYGERIASTLPFFVNPER